MSALPRELLLLLAVAGTLAVGWAVATVPLQGPDEGGHYLYAQHLAETGGGPAADGPGQTASTEFDSAVRLLNLRTTVGVLGSRPANTKLEERRWEQLEDELPETAYSDHDGPNALAKNPQLYYAYEALPYLAFKGAGLFDRLMAMRLWSVLLFVTTVALTWLLAIEVFGPHARLKATIAAGTVALWPMLGFIGGTINPDTALVTAYTATTLAAVRTVLRGPTPGRAAATFGLAAATLLVHGRGLPAVAIAAVALVVAWLRQRAPLRRTGALLAAGAAALVGPVLLSRVILAPGTSSGGLYGGEVNTGRSFSIREFVSQTWQFYVGDRLWFMTPRLGPDYGYRQVWIERWLTGVFGSLEITYPQWVYDVAQVGVIVFLVVLYTAIVLGRDGLRRAWPVLAVLGTFAATLLLLLHAASYRALVTGDDPLVTGRYLLPLVPLAGLLVAWLAGSLPRPARAYAAGGLFAVLLVLNLSGLGITVLRFHV